MKTSESQKSRNRRFYLAVISLTALSCGSKMLAQANNVVAAGSSTNSVAATGSSTNSVPSSGSSTNVTQLGNVTVTARLNQARNNIVPSIGATVYTHTADQINQQSSGANAPLNQVLLRSPGVAEDSAVNGDLHVRGEHANLQYRINDVVLPEGITGFGLELNSHFVQSLQLITGSLPAEYGFRTAGIVDIQTKTGEFQNGGSAEIYGGSFGTIMPTVQYGGTFGKWDYFGLASYNHNDLGIENPTPSYNAIHDTTDQLKTFQYLSYLIDDTSRVSIIGSASYSNFQVPNTPGLPAGNTPASTGDPTSVGWWTQMPGQSATSFNSADLNEQQREQNYYGVVAYQKSVGDFNAQISAFGRMSGVHFMPDAIGDLYFNGVASDVERNLYSGGLQADSSYQITDNNTIRGGAMLIDEVVDANSSSLVFPVDANGNPVGPQENITDNHRLYGLFAGAYLQDEWKFFNQFTINYGARFDWYDASFDNEYQLSPRANLVWEATKSTTLHAGYSRLFTPPPVENVSGADVALFNGTSNQAQVQQDDPVKAERANYFDIGGTQKIAPGLQVGLDGYYKQAKNQLDDGLFGQTLILSAFNYAKGRVMGVEATGSYTHGGFAAYANVAVSKAQGEDWSSAQFLFNPDDLAYVKNHWIYLDHDQTVSGSFGVSYTWHEGDNHSTMAYIDSIYGSGLRTDSTAPDGTVIPNGGSVPAYYNINVGVEQRIKLTRNKTFKARLDVVNITDNIYQLRNGTGVGVNAAQYGERLGFFGTIGLEF